MKKALLYNSSGFTLIETLVAMGVLSIGLPAIAYTFMIALQQESDGVQAFQAQFLANALMNEISFRRFKLPNTHPTSTAATAEITGFDRRGFYHITDYNIFTATWGAQQPPRDETGATMVGFPQFSQAVSVVNVAPPGTGGAARSFASVGAGTSDFQLVTVTISWQNGKRHVALSKVFALTP